MNIKGKLVTLRAIEERDLPALNKWANDPELQDMLSAIHFPSSMDFHNAWFKKLKGDPLNQRFAIDASEIGIIGTSTIMNIDWRNRHAHHGMEIGEKRARGQGYGVDSLMATMRYAFDELGLERLDGWRIEFNAISASLYGKLGWTDEGRRRNYFYRKGRFWDQIPIGITKQDYYRVAKETDYWCETA